VEPIDSQHARISVPVETFRTHFKVVTDAEEVADKGIVRFVGKLCETQEYVEALLRANFLLALSACSEIELPSTRVPFLLETKPEKKAPWLFLGYSVSFANKAYCRA
jgi:hypothetical protein